MRSIFSGLFLFVFSFAAMAATCPEPKNIVRTAGENSWFSNTPGWEGGFNYPIPGTGYSTHISHFLEAQWVQMTNIEQGLGYVVCDYKGNYDDEIIRITQKKDAVSKRPKNVNWSCKIKTDYPSSACTCSGMASQCTF